MLAAAVRAIIARLPLSHCLIISICLRAFCSLIHLLFIAILLKTKVFQTKKNEKINLFPCLVSAVIITNNQ